jgi:hypothetical protein
VAEVPRRPRFPDEDDALGATLFGMLAERLPVGIPRPAAFVFAEEAVRIVDFTPVLTARADLHRFLAGLTTLEGTDVLGVLGVLRRTQPGRPPARVASAFLEWPDGRWSHHARQLDGDGQLAGLEVEVQRAVEGLARPGGLGGWWSRGRFEGLRMRLQPYGEGGMVN